MTAFRLLAVLFVLAALAWFLADSPLFAMPAKPASATPLPTPSASNTPAQAASKTPTAQASPHIVTVHALPPGDVNLRVSPSVASKSQGLLAAGDQLRFEHCQQNWAAVAVLTGQHASKSGWINSYYLEPNPCQ